ncbi:HesA/MoeB/ThiF family protein [Dickeya lacustris]|uniref:ThiF family adenylyltransferase n=1 Tax=Dickeya lacustris TaxID=2259638 RepID=A0ABY8G5F2_9GAMM|nr:ThiF family adenylyltransferase [Dickeya lacustris]WFN55150.1 ThiF family adenylyltransferase [Dickeya lacustris]
MKIKINSSILKCKGKIILLGKRNYQVNDVFNENVHDFLSALESGIEEDKIHEYLNNNSCGYIYEKFKELNLLVLSDNTYDGTAMEKTYDFLNFHLGSLNSPFCFNENIHVAIIGCGGTGANVGLCLATSGIKKISLIDYDNVHISNLNRQFAYDSEDLGKSKTHCLRSKLHRINPDLIISSFDRKISCYEDLNCLPGDVDLLVSAIDTPPIRSSMYTVEYSIRNKIPIIFGSAGYDTITAGPLLITEKAKEDFLGSLIDKSDVETKPITGSIASTNLLLSAILANNITSFFYPFSRPELVDLRKVYDPVSMNTLREVHYGNH